MTFRFDWYLMDYLGEEHIISHIPEEDMTDKEIQEIREQQEYEANKGKCQWCGQPCGDHTICIDCSDQQDAYWGYSRTAD